MINEYKFPLPKGYIVKSISKTKAIQSNISFPCVLKAISPNIVHKSDVKAVKLGIESYDQLIQEMKQMKARLESISLGYEVQGFLIEQMMPSPFIELIIGAKLDPDFGHVIMTGLGGVFVEVLKDISFRLIPISRQDAHEMINELKGKKILDGIRGQAGINKDKLIDLLLLTSDFIQDNPKIFELDFNPVGCSSQGCLVLDERIKIREN